MSDGRTLRHASSFEHDSMGAPFEDLKRRLATINGSNTSLNSATANPRGRIVSVGSSAARPIAPVLEKDLPRSVEYRPGSPTESVVSTTNSVVVKPRFSVGSGESQKAAPAVGSVRTNAVGLLEAPSRPRADLSPDRSSASSAPLANTLQNVRHHLASNMSDGTHVTLKCTLLHD